MQRLKKKVQKGKLANQTKLKSRKNADLTKSAKGWQTKALPTAPIFFNDLQRFFWLAKGWQIFRYLDKYLNTTLPPILPTIFQPYSNHIPTFCQLWYKGILYRLSSFWLASWYNLSFMFGIALVHYDACLRKYVSNKRFMKIKIINYKLNYYEFLEQD